MLKNILGLNTEGIYCTQHSKALLTWRKVEAAPAAKFICLLFTGGQAEISQFTGGTVIVHQYILRLYVSMGNALAVTKGHSIYYLEKHFSYARFAQFEGVLVGNPRKQITLPKFQS